jgi:hypothetical protein
MNNPQLVFHCIFNEGLLSFHLSITLQTFFENFVFLFDWNQIHRSCSRVVGNIRACSKTLKKLFKHIITVFVIKSSSLLFLSSEREKSRVCISSESVVNFVDGFLLEQGLDALLLLRGEFTLGKRDVKRDVQGSEEVTVLVVGHTLALLSDTGPRPCDLIAGYCDFVSVLKKCQLKLNMN